MKIVTRPVHNLVRAATPEEVPPMLSDAGVTLPPAQRAKALVGPVPGLLGLGFGGGMIARLRGHDRDAPPVPTFRSARADRGKAAG